MGLLMKANCERCQKVVGFGDEVYICSFECTWCQSCYHALGAICPNCQGELVRRPKRRNT